MGQANPAYPSILKALALKVVAKAPVIPSPTLAVNPHEILAPMPLRVNYNNVSPFKKKVTEYQEKPEYQKDSKFDGFGYPVGGGF